jgi:mono-ADP-ribosyltransferase sirtuin 6
MSLGYAEKLSYRDDLGGQLGAPELSEESTDLNNKVQQLTNLVRTCSKDDAFIY